MQIGSIGVAFSSVVDRLGPIVAENSARADAKSLRVASGNKVSRGPTDELQLSGEAGGGEAGGRRWLVN